MSESWFEGVGLAESPFAEAESAVTDEVEALAEPWPAEAVGLPPSWPADEEDGAGGELAFAAEAWTPWAPTEALNEAWGEAEEEGPGSGRLAADRLEWPGATADQLAFMRAVYEQHLERSRAKGEPFTADLPDNQLDTIEGKHRARTDAAAAARALLAEARAALAAAGLADKVRIGIISAYRSASQQFDIWQGKGRKGGGGFPHYYGEMLRRDRLHPGDYGPQAVAAMATEMAKFIAAPGYSNHQDGLAIDFGIGLVGRGLGKIGERAWFHKWLVGRDAQGRQNAARHGFHPYHKEAWHWVYRGPAGSEALAGEVATAARPGELPVERAPLLAGHRGRPPDLLLRWNVTSLPEVIDVVVHLHGYWYAGLRLEDNVKPWSGLDLAPVDGAAGSGRSRPTLTVLPRGNDTGVKQPKGPFNRYTFPALVTRDGLPGLVRFSLERFAAKLGGPTPRVGRLILTAHSGGGAALLQILEHHDPHQVHLFDALYQDAGRLAAWARRRIQRDRAELAALGAASAREYMATRGGALRVFYGRGTRYHSRKLQAAIAADLDRALAPWYRVEASRYGHFQIPRRYGWRVLADAAADVPGASTEPVTHRELEEPPEAEEPRFEEAQLDEEPRFEEQEDEYEGEFEEEYEDEVEAGEVELGEAEAFFDQVDEETGATVTFPSGATLRVVPGPTGEGEEHYDPAATGNPLLDTGEPVRSTLLSANFTVGELSRSGPHRFDKARIDPELVRSLQRLRDHLDKPMRITSSYRPYLYNDKLYKEKYKRKPTRSRHSSGQAADIQIAGMAGMEIAKAAIDVLGPDIGVGIADTYAHVDVRGRWARWTYFGDGTEKHRLAIAEIDAYRRRRQQAGAPSSGEQWEAEEPEGEGGEPPWAGLAEAELDQAEAGELAAIDTPMAGEGSLVDAIMAIPQAIGIGGAIAGWLRDVATGAPPAQAAQDFVDRLIVGGNRDRNKLTNIVFALAHPSVGIRPLDPTDRGDQPLVKDWLRIRDRLVDPGLRRAASGRQGVSQRVAGAGGKQSPGHTAPPVQLGHDCPEQRPAGEAAQSRSADGILAIDVTFIETDRAIIIEDFPVDSAVLPSGVTTSSGWQRVMSFLVGDPTSLASVRGFTDCIGTNPENFGLRKRRAEAVVAAMPPKAQTRVLSLDYSATTDFRATNSTPEGRAQNRAATVTYSLDTSTKPGPVAVAKATNLDEYLYLVRSLERRLNLTTDAAKALSVLRQIYYGSAPWGDKAKRHFAWDAVITKQPWSPDEDPTPRMGEPLMEALKASHTVDTKASHTVDCKASHTVDCTDLGHVLTGIDAMMQPGNVTLGLVTQFLPNEAWATWAGDVGSAAAEWGVDLAYGKPRGDVEVYMHRQAGDADLAGDIDSFALRAGLNASRGPAQLMQPIRLRGSLSDTLLEYYRITNSGPGKSRQTAARNFIEAYGGSVVGGQLQRRAQLESNLRPYVSRFANLYGRQLAAKNNQAGLSQTTDYFPLIAENGFTVTSVTSRFVDWLLKRALAEPGP